MVLPWEVSRTVKESPNKKAGRKKVYREKSAEVVVVMDIMKDGTIYSVSNTGNA